MISTSIRTTFTVLSVVILLGVVSTPVNGQFFLCEKTGANGEPISPESPQYESAEYDSTILPFIREIVKLALIGMFVIGVGGAIYATVKDSMYAPEGGDDAAKYIRMRSRLLVLGIAFPILIFLGSLVVEFFTFYETTCFMPSVI